MSEKRKIILKEPEISQNENESAEDFEARAEYVKLAPQSFNFKGALTAIPGKPLEVSEEQARLAVASGKFDYTDETVEALSVPVQGGIPADFPHAQKLRTAAGGFATIDELKNASDEDILRIEGIGKNSLAQIRAALEIFGGEK